MRKLFILYIMCFYLLVACQNDFDEQKDSSMRHITFTLDASHIFDSILDNPSANNFTYGIPATLDDDKRLRITAYCYDQNDSLLQRQTITGTELSITSLTFRHLNKDIDYNFVFIADVVKYDPYVDYYETWYQMDTHNWKRFYLFSDSRNERPQQDVMFTKQLKAKPFNQNIEVQLDQLTYNGYCVFTNTEKVDRLTGYAGYVNAFRLSTKSWIRRTSFFYEFSYYQPTETSIILPLNLSYADSVIYVKAKSTTLSGTDSVIVNIPNTRRCPFVVTIDCETSKLEDYKFY